jgi:hypothetical protein
VKPAVQSAANVRHWFSQLSLGSGEGKGNERMPTVDRYNGFVAGVKSILNQRAQLRKSLSLIPEFSGSSGRDAFLSHSFASFRFNFILYGFLGGSEKRKSLVIKRHFMPRLNRCKW